MDKVRRAIVLAAFAAPCSGTAAPPAAGKPRKVVICLGPSNTPGPIDPNREAFVKEFATHGLNDGREIEIAIVRPPGTRWRTMAEDFKQAMSLNPHVIMRPADGLLDMELLVPIVGDIPLVIWSVFDGFEDSLEVLNRRGVNVTGVMHSSIELAAKRFALLKELRPSAKRVALVGRRWPEPLNPRMEQQTQRQIDRYSSDARAAGMELFVMLPEVDTPVETTIAELRKARISVAEFPWGDGPGFWDQLAANGIAASGRARKAAIDGALLAGWPVGPIPTAIRLAAMVLRGRRASELPVERLMEFRLAINLRTARKLGITVPPAVLLQAHEVFE